MEVKGVKELEIEELKDMILQKLGCTGELIYRYKRNMGKSAYLILHYGDSACQPVIALEKMMEESAEMPIGSFLDNVKVWVENDLPHIPKPDLSEQIADINRVLPTLINTEANRDLLGTVPHRELLDLSVIYQIPVDCDGVNGGIMVTNKMAANCSLTEEQLYESAMKNLQVRLTSFNTVMEAIMGTDAKFELPGSYVYTNDSGQYGAAAILNEEVLADLSAKTGKDLFIQPCSVHEVLVHPANDEDGTANALAQMVAAINKTSLEVADILSNSLYRYSPGKGLTIEVMGEKL